MIGTILAIGAFALKWIGGGAGILGALSAIIRLPWISGWVSAIPMIGPVITELAKVILGWIDTGARFLARCTLALLEAIAGKPMIAVPILLALYGQHLYFEKWKYRNWTPPAAAAAPSVTEPGIRWPVVAEPAPTQPALAPPQKQQRRRAAPRCETPFDACWWDRLG